VIFHPRLDLRVLDGVRDSKKLSARKRQAMVPIIRQHAMAIGIGAASAREIDALNIARATALAMRRSLARIAPYDHVLVDGTPVPELGDNQTAIVKGDMTSLSIAAASIIAKEVRDTLMRKLASLEAYAPFGWQSNAGYAAPVHREAIARLGLTPHHRRSFGNQLALDLS
jgi:ribonuclease HII